MGHPSAEYIACPHWLNIVAAAAATVPMVPTSMHAIVNSQTC